MSIDNLRRDIVAIAIARGNTSIDHLEDIARDLAGLSIYIGCLPRLNDEAYDLEMKRMIADEVDDPIDSWADGDPF